mgnify:CR=1 FL=1
MKKENKTCSECQFEKGHSRECSKFVELKNPIKKKKEALDWHKSDTAITDFIEWLEEEDRQNWEIERYFEDLLKEERKRVIDTIDKVYKKEHGIHNWLDLRDKLNKLTT